MDILSDFMKKIVKFVKKNSLSRKKGPNKICPLGGLVPVLGDNIGVFSTSRGLQCSFLEKLYYFRHFFQAKCS